jgi:hypothetical protein
VPRRVVAGPCCCQVRRQPQQLSWQAARVAIAGAAQQPSPRQVSRPSLTATPAIKTRRWDPAATSRTRRCQPYPGRRRRRARRKTGSGRRRRGVGGGGAERVRQTLLGARSTTPGGAVPRGKGLSRGRGVCLPNPQRRESRPTLGPRTGPPMPASWPRSGSRRPSQRGSSSSYSPSSSPSPREHHPRRSLTHRHSHSSWVFLASSSTSTLRNSVFFVSALRGGRHFVSTSRPPSAPGSGPQAIARNRKSDRHQLPRHDRVSRRQDCFPCGTDASGDPGTPCCATCTQS